MDNGNSPPSRDGDRGGLPWLKRPRVPSPATKMPVTPSSPLKEKYAEEHLDTVLIGCDGEVRCHASIILAKCCHYLDPNKKNFIIFVPDFTLQELEQMLMYCYTGR